MPNIPQRSATSQPPFRTIINHFRSTTSPKVASDLLNKDVPIMSLHINQFSDVTCVGLALPHAVVDMMGIGIIMRTWCSIMADDRVKVPSLIVGDPLAKYGAPYPTTRSGVKELRASMIGTTRVWGLQSKIRYFGRLILELVLSPKEHCGLFFIPMSVVDRIREEGKRGAKESSNDNGGSPWVSENDVITAILVKVRIVFIFLYSVLYLTPSQIYSLGRSQTDKTPFTIAFTGNIRGQLPSLPKDSSSVWIHNAIVPITVPSFATCQLPDLSIYQIALNVRKAIIAQRNVEEISKELTVYRENARRGNHQAFHSSYGMSYYLTSWSSAKLADLDFRPAFLAQDSRELHSEGGRVIFAGGSVSMTELGRRAWAITLSKQGKDGSGESGYWCETGTVVKVWPLVEEFLNSLRSGTQ